MRETEKERRKVQGNDKKRAESGNEQAMQNCGTNARNREKQTHSSVNYPILSLW